MKIRLLVLGLCLSAFTSQASAQEIRDVFKQMPDSLVPYLTQNNRLDFLDFLDSNMKAEVKNRMNGQSTMDTLTADYTRVRLSESSAIQLKLLPAQSDSVVCMVRTFSAPASESFVSFFSTSWQPIASDFGLSGVGVMQGTDAEASALLDAFTERPDTMSVSRFQELKKLIDPVMVSASLSPVHPEIIFSLSIPVATAEEKQQLSAILVQRKYKWEGGKFNKH